MLRHYKTRLLGETEEGIWLESVPSEGPLIDALINTQQLCGLSFRLGPTKLALTVPILRRVSEYAINAQSKVQALLVRSGAVRTIQRRNSYRVRITPEDGLAIRLWRLPERAQLRDKIPAAAEVKAQLRNLSVGGAGVLIEGQNNDPPKILMNQRLRISLTFGEQEMVFEGRVASLQPVLNRQNILHVGVHFRVDSDLPGRQVLHELTRIVGQLQREEARRNRLGLKSA